MKLLLAFVSKYWFILLAFLIPVHISLISIYFLLIVDLITGIWASIKVKKERITSTRLSDSINKALAYTITIVLVYVMQLHLLASLPLVATTGVFIACIELYSVFENLYLATNISTFNVFMQITKIGQSNFLLKVIDFLKTIKDRNK